MSSTIDVMDRTTIMIPEALKAGLMRRAKQERTSFAELLRRALQKYLMASSSASEDTFLASSTVFDDNGPSDVTDRHDVYLMNAGAHGQPHLEPRRRTGRR